MKRGLIFVMLMVLVLFGCASAPIVPAPFTGDVQSLSPLTVIAFSTADIRQVTAGRTMAGALLTLGMGSNAIAESGGKAMQKEYGLPDIGQEIKKKFVAKIKEDIPYWPEMQVEESPVPLGPFKTPNSILVFRTFFIQVADGGTCQGLCAYTDLVLSGKNGLKYQKRYVYKSKDFGRAPESFDDFEKDGGKLLKEEMEFAVGQTVKALIESLKGTEGVASGKGTSGM